MNDAPLSNFWADSAPGDASPRPALTGHHEADVAIIGAGLTGLWTAYYLKTLSPGLAIRVLEAERVGHGASGRNGGWVIGSLAGLSRLVEGLSRDERGACCRMLADNVDAIGATLEREGIEAEFHKGGAIHAAARYAGQEAIQRAYLEHLHALGHAEEACYWLDAAELAERAHFRNPRGGVFQRDCATVHPLKLLRGLAGRLEAMGVTIHEQSRVRSRHPRGVTTESGHLRAEVTVSATEGYCAGLAEMQRYVLPVQSLVIATEPLPASRWAEIGMAGRPAFADASRLVNYGHRTADDRLLFGARGNYRLGGRPTSGQAIPARAVTLRRDLLVDLFPALEGVTITHGWGGSLGLSRRFRPHALLDRASGLAMAGGYAGEGVAASHLFARTLADMILERDTDLTRMPWAMDETHPSHGLRRWEPEPFRWLAAQLISLSYAGEEALMRRERSLGIVRPALARLNDAVASIIE
ncbi:MAG: NAD(P)/FAD-dependent oxidoreductase [Pseudomonadota bacterium]